MLNKPKKTITNFKNNWLKTNKSRYLNKDNRFKLFSSIQINKLGSTSFNYNNLIFFNTKGFNTKRQMINLKRLKTDFINIYIKKEFITTKFFKLLFERVEFILKTNIDHSFHAKIVLDKIFKKKLQKKKFFNRYKTFSPSITRIFQTVTHSFSVFLRNKLIFFSRNSLLYLIYFMSSLNTWLICLYVNVIKYVFTERKRSFMGLFLKILKNNNKIVQFQQTTSFFLIICQLSLPFFHRKTKNWVKIFKMVEKVVKKIKIEFCIIHQKPLIYINQHFPTLFQNKICILPLPQNYVHILIFNFILNFTLAYFPKQKPTQIKKNVHRPTLPSFFFNITL